MARQVTVECHGSGVKKRSYLFEVFDGRLPVTGHGGLLEAFGAKTLLWQDSCAVSVTSEGLSRRLIPEGTDKVRVYRHRDQCPGAQSGGE